MTNTDASNEQFMMDPKGAVRRGKGAARNWPGDAGGLPLHPESPPAPARRTSGSR